MSLATAVAASAAVKKATKKKEWTNKKFRDMEKYENSKRVRKKKVAFSVDDSLPSR